MLKVDSGRLREPAAWIMLAVVATNVLFGVVHLFFGSASFTMRAMAYLSAFVSPLNTALAAAAVLLVTRAGDPTARARLVNLGTMALLGLAALLGLVATIGGFFAGGSFGDKIEYLILALPQVALAAVGMLFARSSIGADVPRRGAARSEERFFGFPDEGFAGYNPQQAQLMQPVQGASGAPSYAPTQVEQAYVAGQGDPAFGQAQGEQAFGQAQNEPAFGQAQGDPTFGQAQNEPAYGQSQPYAASSASPAQGFQDGYAPAPQPANHGYPPQEPQPVGHFGSQGHAPESQGYGSEPQGYAEPQQPAAVVPYGQQQPSQQPSPGGQQPAQPQHAPSQPPVQPAPPVQAVQPVQQAPQPPVQPVPQAFPQATGGYPQPPQGPMFDQHGYAGQQGEAAGYGAFGAQQDNSSFPPVPQIEAPGYANQGYTDQSFGQSAYPAAEQAQPFGHQQEQYGQQAEPYGQQGPASFSGYSGGQFGHNQAAEQASSFEQPAQGFDPSRPYEQAVDPREQQLAAAYQQAQNYQQHAQPADYAGSQTAPQDYPEYYDNPLGHAQTPDSSRYSAPSDQTPDSSRYSAPSDQTMRFDASLYQGDPLSGPLRREDTIDPTAIYAPERSQAKLEEGVSTEQAGHGADPQAPWYGSQR
ncbi:hypothetical protein [Microtetraspora sp. NBRC 16547]|uniref:hypothetical protein n=1 Tax=Microtetraspora sp. NBRC 16547 TaxID=3030993 RepID=UPI00255460EB|nr:hypothetical protein [Microtetraspora sp. NBRC 16547]